MTHRSPDGLAAAKLPLSLSDREWQRFQRVRTIATLLDNAIEIPILRYRVGLDPLIGLLPIGGGIWSVFCYQFIWLWNRPDWACRPPCSRA
jgi:hypothetical protein